MADKPEPVRRLPRARRREQILSAATEAFARNGLAATSPEDIAAQAGVTRMLLYRHFDSKTELHQATMGVLGAAVGSNVDCPPSQTRPMEGPTR